MEERNEFERSKERRTQCWCFLSSDHVPCTHVSLGCGTLLRALERYVMVWTTIVLGYFVHVFVPRARQRYRFDHQSGTQEKLRFPSFAKRMLSGPSFQGWNTQKSTLLLTGGTASAAPYMNHHLLFPGYYNLTLTHIYADGGPYKSIAHAATAVDSIWEEPSNFREEDGISKWVCSGSCRSATSMSVMLLGFGLLVLVHSGLA